jgi:hypothetical protein
MFKAGGREARQRYAGTFREAKIRRDWIAGELAALRMPDLRPTVPGPVETLAVVAERWRTSRIAVADGTAQTHRVNLGRILPLLGSKSPSEITESDVADLIGKLAVDGLGRESIRKTRSTLAMILDRERVSPNPARSKSIELPREDREEVRPPEAGHVLAVHRLPPTSYRLPLLVLETTGMRVGELEGLTTSPG